MDQSLAMQAFVFGIISAASLPIGAALAMVWTPRQRLVAGLMAFGGGALLAALTLDLVGEAMRKGEFYPLALGCLLGCALFIVLNQVVNRHGGFLRKAATTISHLRQQKRQHVTRVFETLSHVPLFRELPPEEVRDLVHYLTPRTFAKGTTVIRQGDPGDGFFIIDRGAVEVIDERAGRHTVATLGAGDVLGEMALVTGEPRSATAIAADETRAWIVLKEHFDRLVQTSPVLAEAVRRLAARRTENLKRSRAGDGEGAAEWAAAATRDLEGKIAAPTQTEIKEAALAHGGAPLAIWLGILLDGIPESLVIGSSLLHATISISLIAGLFLSNFPEALSSSVGMREQRYSAGRILLMWTSLMIFTGIGAYVGNLFFVGVPQAVFALVEGVAAGAMLTMIAETMLPEAYHRGGAITGASTLLGFLAAIFFKTLE
ncbi:MAG: cyclic nucleotide-binding domain-containing protein [Candidatus Rokubacteria bacterium]|nr:cyclic nucleotide-binding domain-containing protein [Candidatus Rokubacteria bacterium]